MKPAMDRLPGAEIINLDARRSKPTAAVVDTGDEAIRLFYCFDRERRLAILSIMRGMLSSPNGGPAA